MGRIDASRVLVGGLLAGVVINIGEYLLNEPVLGDQMAAAMADMGLEYSSGAIPTFVALSFVMGIVVVWAYAAMRPRYGPGPGTAVRAGLLAWFFGYAIQTAGWMLMGVYGAGTAALVLVWGLVELPLATVVGAWLYREPGEAPAGAVPGGSPAATAARETRSEPHVPAGGAGGGGSLGGAGSRPGGGFGGDAGGPASGDAGGAGGDDSGGGGSWPDGRRDLDL